MSASPAPPEPRRLYLLGFMGAGKTTVGKLLSRRLDWPFVDLDREIEKEVDRSIPRIFRRMGESSFRQLELRLLDRVSAKSPPLIIACGGGVPVSARNRRIMERSGVPVHLRITPETSLRRIRRDPHRPLFAEGEDALEQLRQLWEERREAYDAIPNQIDADDRAPEEIVDEIVQLLRDLSALHS